MMILISGKPGNGKTLRALALMRDEYERNMQAVKEGKEEPRRFFTNIEGATCDENPQAFPWVEKLEPGADWTKLPDGSFVVYDEAHADGATPGLERYGRLFPATGKPGESDDLRIRAMATHRHRGFDLVFLTQWPSKIHHNVRQLCGKHIHMNRAFGMERAGVLTWNRVQADPYDERERDKAEEEIWTYPKELYSRYRSATLHTVTHKFRMPKKLLAALCMVPVGLLVLWVLWAFVFKPAVPEAEAAADRPAPSGAAAPPPSGGFVFSPISSGASTAQAVQAVPSSTLAGCVSSDRGCRCFNGEGSQLDMTRQECEAVLSRPMPFNVFHQFKAAVQPPQQSQEVRSRAEAVTGAGGPSSAVVGASPLVSPQGQFEADAHAVKADVGEFQM